MSSNREERRKSSTSILKNKRSKKKIKVYIQIDLDDQ
jgi:hypothetical protein